MTEKRAQKADKLPVDDIDGGTVFVADEDVFDRRRLLWRLTSWGVAAIGAVSIAILANQSSITLRRDQAATAELARQTQQIRALARQNHTEASRLASAIEALDGDRDQLDARVAVLEQGLESVTGSIARQARAQKPKDTPAASPAIAASSLPTAASSLPHHKIEAAASAPQPVPVIAAPTTSATAAPPAMAAAPSDNSQPTPTSSAVSKTASNAPDSTESVARPETKVMASVQAATTDVASTAAPSAPVQRTEFGVDLGSANSIEGLRALWRGILRAHSKEVGSLEPIMVIKERTNGLGMRLHLVAGPLSDAAAAARICAALAERKRSCETSVYDGQRLALRDSKQSAGESAIAKPQPAHHTVSRHKRISRLTRIEQPVPLPVPPPPPDPAPSRSRSFFSH